MTVRCPASLTITVESTLSPPLQALALQESSPFSLGQLQPTPYSSGLRTENGCTPSAVAVFLLTAPSFLPPAVRPQPLPQSGGG